MLMNKHLFTSIVIFCCATIQPSLANDELYVVSGYTQDGFSQILREFRSSTGIGLKVESMDQGDLKTKLMNTMLESNQAPDAIVVPADHMGLYRFIKYSHIDPHLFKANIPERIWDTGMSDGKLYGAPLIQGNYLVLYYNKNLVKEPALDWDTLLTQKTGFDAKGVATIAWSYDEAFWFLPFLGAFGGWPLQDGKVALDTPAMAAALDFYKDLRIKQLPFPNCNYQCAIDLFKAGKVAYTIDGEWQAAEYSRVLGDKLGVSALPKAQGKKMISVFSTYVIAFPNNSLSGEKRTSLMQLVNYLQSPTVQQRMWKEVKAIPVEANAFKYAQENTQDYLKQTLALMADTKPLPADQSMTFIWDAMVKGAMRHREGGIDSKKAALFMQQSAERNISNAQKQAELDTPLPKP